MATRPVFEVSADEKIFTRCDVQFKWFGGFALTQTRKNIHGLHENYLATHAGRKILEISSKSEDDLGIKLSAFNLNLSGGVSLESAFQGSKVFEHGGPYVDIIGRPSVRAKSDERLRTSGKIIGFNFDGKNFPINPPTFFYDWLYVTTLAANKNLADELLTREFDAFTDIAFNPQRSLNCQARSAAIFVSLSRKNLLDAALDDEKIFLRTVYKVDG